MKRWSTLLLALCLLLGGTAAMAEDTQITESSQDSTATTMVTYEVTSGYTVVIPSEVSFPADTTETTMTITLKQGARFEADKWLCVYLENSANGFQLKTTDGAAIKYSVKKQSGSMVNAGSWICRNSAEQLIPKDNPITLTLTLTGTAVVPGTYSDTLTFRVALEDSTTP